MTNKLSENEYTFLVRGGDGLELNQFYSLGLECYAEGYIDDFGMITQKGKKAIKKYEEKMYD